MKIKFCRICGDTSDKVPFYQNLNKCRDCALAEMSEYNKLRNKDPKYIEARRSRWNKWRQSNTRIRNSDMEKRSKQSSPRRFLTDKMSHIKRVCKKKEIEFDMSLDMLDQLWEEQGERCAVSGVQMTHKNGDLSSVRIDRISEDLGYISGNIRLVCDGVKRLKKNSNDDAVNKFIQEIKTIVMINHNKYKF